MAIRPPLKVKNNKLKKTKSTKRRPGKITIALAIIVLVAAALFIDSNTRIVTTEYELYYPNLPDAFDGYRIVVLSDMHGAEYGKNNERLITKIEAAQPDIIAITGDLIDRFQAKKPVEKQIEIAETLLKSIMPIAPVYYITGNHEWDSGALWELFTMLEEQGVHILRNKYVRIHSGGESIILAGTDDPNGPADMKKPREFVEGIFESEGNGFIVMLEHRNYNLNLYSELGVDLVLSGHAHGGMVRLPFTDGLIGPSLELFPTYTAGVYTKGDTNLLVSRGIGNHLGWTRFLNNPQITVAVLRTA